MGANAKTKRENSQLQRENASLLRANTLLQTDKDRATLLKALRDAKCVAI